MEILSLEKLFTDMTYLILKNAIKDPDIRLTYPLDKPPECDAEQNIIFLRLLEQESEYSQQLDTSYITIANTLVKHTTRTRVWEVQFAVYGPQAHTNITQIKDGVFRQDVKQLLSANNVFLVPDMPYSRRITEQTVAANLNRWDISLSFNELYTLPDEAVGHIEQVSINTRYNK